jgi:hypothetical protein
LCRLCLPHAISIVSGRVIPGLRPRPCVVCDPLRLGDGGRLLSQIARVHWRLRGWSCAATGRVRRRDARGRGGGGRTELQQTLRDRPWNAESSRSTGHTKRDSASAATRMGSRAYAVHGIVCILWTRDLVPRGKVNPRRLLEGRQSPQSPRRGADAEEGARQRTLRSVVMCWNTSHQISEGGGGNCGT